MAPLHFDYMPHMRITRFNLQRPIFLIQPSFLIQRESAKIWYAINNKKSDTNIICVNLKNNLKIRFYFVKERNYVIQVAKARDVSRKIQRKI